MRHLVQYIVLIVICANNYLFAQEYTYNPERPIMVRKAPKGQSKSLYGYFITFDCIDGVNRFMDSKYDYEERFPESVIINNDSVIVKNEYDYDFDYPNIYTIYYSKEYIPDCDISAEPITDEIDYHPKYIKISLEYQKEKPRIRDNVYTSKGNYIKGYKDGKWVTYYKGVSVKTEYYQMGRRSGVYQVCDTLGTNLYSIDLGKEGDGIIENYYSNGVLKYSQMYQDGKRDGRYRGFYETGIIKSDGFYDSGLQDGQWHYYDSNGNVVQHINFIKGRVPIYEVSIKLHLPDSLCHLKEGIVFAHNRLNQDVDLMRIGNYNIKLDNSFRFKIS